MPLGEVATVKLTRADRSAPRTRQLAVYIFVDIRDRDLGGYVADAQRGRAARSGQVPARLLRGVERPVRISGARRRRAEAIVVPVTLLIIFLLLYLNFRRLTETLIVMLSLPFALVGGAVADVVAGLQPERRGRRRLHRAGRRRRRDRRDHADLSRPRLGRSAARSCAPKAGLHPRAICTRRSWKARSSACGRR
jgi:Cu(I)/Ag(I) efflux system membrane protein CusA/SilA